MKNWDDWGDYEINKTIVKLLGISFEDMNDFKPEPYIFNEDKKSVFDPCNNWSDIGPIMLENGISLTKVSDSGEHLYCVNDGYWHHGNFIDSNIEYVHTNPLRAAAIVFLMMNGVKP